MKGLNSFIKKERILNGDCKGRGVHVAKRRLGSNDRPKRCIPSCPNRSTSQKAPEVLVRRDPIPVSAPPFRAELGPKNLHQIDFAHHYPVQVKGHKSDRLLRRLSDTGKNTKQVKKASGFSLKILGLAGFKRNAKKCCLDPRQRFEYLGLCWDTRQHRVFLPEQKKVQFRTLAGELLRTKSLETAQQFLGKALFARRAVSLGKMSLRPLQLATIEGLRSGSFIVSQETRRAILWWSRPPGEGMPLQERAFSMVLSTDASMFG